MTIHTVWVLFHRQGQCNDPRDIAVGSTCILHEEYVLSILDVDGWSESDLGGYKVHSTSKYLRTSQTTDQTISLNHNI